MPSLIGETVTLTVSIDTFPQPNTNPIFSQTFTVGAAAEIIAAPITWQVQSSIGPGPTDYVTLNASGVINVDVADDDFTINFVGSSQPSGLRFVLSSLADESIFSVTAATQTGVAGLGSYGNIPITPSVSNSIVTSGFQLVGGDTNANYYQAVQLTFGTPPSNVAPVITSPGTASVNENTSSVMTVVATDANSDAITYSLSGGADQAKFTINVTTGALTFVSPPNFEAPTDAGANNVYDVQVSASDGTLSTTQNVAVTVQNVNEAPTATNDTYTLDEDTVLTTTTPGVLDNDTDPDAGAVLSAVLVGGPAHGSLTLNADGSFTYTPVANYSGPDSFTYKANDGTVDSNVATVNITVSAVRDDPTAVADAATTNEDTAVTIAVQDNDINPDGSTLNFSYTPTAEHGTVAINGNGTLTYTPNANFNGIDTFTYEINDNAGRGDFGTSSALVTVTVLPVADAPEGTDNTITLDEDATYTFAAADFGFTDADAGDTLQSVRIDTLTIDADATLQLSGADVTAGQVIAVADIGNLVFTPGADENGAAYSSFTFSVSDGTLYDVAPNTMTLDVTAVNDDPVLDGPSTATTDEDTDLVFSTANGNALSISDVDVGGGTVSVRAYVVGGIAGTLSLGSTSGLTLSVGDGTDDPAQYFTGSLADVNAALEGLTFTPDEDFNGTATLNIAIRDDGNTGTGGGTTIDNLIEVTVNAVNDAPTIDLDISNTVVWDQYAFNPGDNFNISDFVSAENFSLADDTVLTTFNVYLADRSGINDGTFSNFNGTLSWAIYTNDGSPTPAVFITTGDDTDPDVTFTGIVSGTSRDIFAAEIDLGAVSLAAGDYWIALHEGAWQSPSDGTPIAWMQAASDGNAISRAFSDNEENPDSNWSSTLDPAAFSLGSQAITATEQVPLDLKGIIAVGDVDSGAGDITVTIGVDFGVLDVAPGTSGAEVTGSGTGAVTLTGTLAEIQTLLGSGGDSVVTYTANSDTPPASASLSITVDDNGNTGSGGAMQASTGATILIEATNDAPEADATQDLTIAEDTDTGAIAIGATDPEGEDLEYSLVRGEGPANGTVTLNDGEFVYTPNPDFNGTDSFTILIEDPSGASTQQVVEVTVTPVNDAPVAFNDIVYGEVDTELTIPFADLLVNDIDVDGDGLTVIAVFAQSGGTPVIDGSTVVFTPDSGFAGPAYFTYTVADGEGATSTAVVRVQIDGEGAPVDPENTDPQVSDDSVGLTTFVDTGITYTVQATDADDDPLAFTLGDPANGTATISDEGTVLYVPDDGYTGTDTFLITVSDGNGGSATQLVTVQVAEFALDDTFYLVTEDGFSGAVGGSGSMFGTAGFQSITVIDRPGTVVFDPSFNAGGDIVTLDGDAADWFVARQGSSALLSDGDTFVVLPAGPAGMAVAFADGVRTLEISDGALVLGTQVLDATLTQVTSPVSSDPLPVDSGAPGRADLLLFAGADASAGGDVDVFGTNDAETITLLYGDVTLDPSFNRGDDTLVLPFDPEVFTATQMGSSVELDTLELDVLIPFGTAGMDIVFDGETRVLVFEDSALLIGTQAIDSGGTILIA